MNFYIVDTASRLQTLKKKEKKEKIIQYVRQPCIPRSDAKITHEVRLVFRWYNNKIKFTSAKKIEVCIVNSNVVGETYDSTINPFNDLITRRPTE